MTKPETDILEYAKPSQQGYSRLLLAFCSITTFVTTLSLVGIGVAAFFNSAMTGPRTVAFAFAIALPSAFLTRKYVRRLILSDRIDHQRLSEKWFAVSCSVTSLLLALSTIQTWSCIHASTFCVGPLGISWSNVGGPCNAYYECDKNIKLTEHLYISW